MTLSLFFRALRFTPPATRPWAMLGAFTAVASWCFPASSLAQTPGNLDAGFNPSIRIYGTVTVITPQPDGKLLIGGDFSRIGSTNIAALARLNADGSIDTSFTPPTNLGVLVYAAVGANNKVSVLFKRPGNTIPTYALLCLNADGSQDAGFTPVSFAGLPDSGELYDFVLAVQPDGKVLVGGPFSTDPNTSDTDDTVRRYNTDGSPDTGFRMPDTLQVRVINTLLPVAGGQTLVGGSFAVRDSEYNFNSHPVIRINADGSLDGSYPAGDARFAEAYALTAQSDGKVLFLQNPNGSFDTLSGVPRRLNADGSLDAGFAPTFDAGAAFESLVLQPDGKIVVGGYTANNPSGDTIAGPKSGVVRLNADGTTDVTFHPLTPLVEDRVTALGLQVNGQVIVGGAFNSFSGLTRGSLGRINADGSADATFVSSLTNAGAAYSVVVGAGGKPLVADTGSLVNGMLASSLNSFNADGSLSTVFAANLSSSQFFPTHGYTFESFNPVVAPQSDGKVLLTGNFQASADGYIALLRRFNADGSRDASFQFPMYSGYTVLQALAPQPNGQIFVAGALGYGGSVYPFPLNRLNADGSIDPAFAPVTDPGATNYSSGGINALAVQPDGKPLVAGDFVYVNGHPQPAVLRFNTDGTIDTSFNAGTFTTTDTESGSASVLALQANGKLLVGGAFVGVGGLAINNLARLNADGGVDTSFNAGGAGPNGYVQSIVVQPNGQIVLAGGFTMVDGVPLAGVARLNADGTVDPFFCPGTGTGGTGNINSLALAPDGSIIVGGTFTAFNGQARDGVAKLVGGALTAPVITAATATGQVGVAFNYAIPASEQPTSYAATGLPAGLSLSASAGVISGTPTVAGTFTVALSAANPVGTGTGSLTITINPATPVVRGGNVAGQIGVFFSYQVSATNSPTGYGAAPLPNGLTINPATGLISGTPAAAGTFAVALGATNVGGTGTATLTLTLTPVPTVTIMALGAADAMEGGENAKVAIRRDGALTDPLTVRYKVAGGIVAGKDYKALTGVAIIPAGATQAKIKVKSIDDSVHEGTRTAKIKLKAATDGSYLVGKPSAAKVKIIDND